VEVEKGMHDVCVAARRQQLERQPNHGFNVAMHTWESVNQRHNGDKLDAHKCAGILV